MVGAARQASRDVIRRGGADNGRDARIFIGQQLGQHRGRGYGGWYDADDDGPRDIAATITHVVSQRMTVGHDALGPDQRAFTLSGQPAEPLATIHQLSLKVVLEARDAVGQRRLCHVARSRRARKMLFTGERDEVLEVSHFHAGGT